MAGDWDGDGKETVGAFDSLRAEFTIYHGTRDGAWPAFVGYGSAGMVPVAGFFGDLPGGDSAPERRIGLPAMDIGSEGPDVVVLQNALAERGLYRGPIDGIYDSEVSYGVVTLKKVMDVERTFSFGPSDWQLLSRFELPKLPDRPDEPDRVEVDIGRQVLYVILDGEVETIVAISSGGSYTYFSPNQQTLVSAGTPRGDFNLFHFATGWHCDPVTTWCIYNPWSFTPYYAIHGYGSVPAYPASHGCVRVTVTDADSLVGYLHVGIPLHIWDVHKEEAT
ncbi:murein L,D-transpeptidase [bacterium]|nr:murein L,D-transpeptidase [bacterium]